MVRQVQHQHAYQHPQVGHKVVERVGLRHEALYIGAFRPSGARFRIPMCQSLTDHGDIFHARRDTIARKD